MLVWAGRRGRPGPAARRVAPKATAPVGGHAPGPRERALPWRAVVLPWNTRTVTCSRVPVSDDVPSTTSEFRNQEHVLVLYYLP